MKRTALSVVVLIVLAMGVTAAASTIKPGTAAQVKALVAASSKIEKLSPVVEGQLATDSTAEVKGVSCPTPTTCGCFTATQCIVGDETSKNVVVLMGDSHASMWSVAVANAGVTLKVRVVILYAISCPVAELTSVSYFGNQPDSNCNSWRAGSIAVIKQLKPKLVLLAERTGQVGTEPGNEPISNAVWQAALQKTILQIQTKSTKVAIIQDVPFFDYYSPASCLAAYPKHVQTCSVPYPNPKYPGHQIAEMDAAKATKTSLLKTIQWLCTKTCSPVIGNYVAYSNQSHVSLEYSTYLSGVMTAAIKPLL